MADATAAIVIRTEIEVERRRGGVERFGLIASIIQKDGDAR